MQFNIEITGPYESKTVSVDGEVSIGRTDQATVAVDDTGLSRVNTTFFIDDGELLVADENSTNGTFVNGERVTRPRAVRPGDEIKIGSATIIRLISDKPVGELRSIPAPDPVEPANISPVAMLKANEPEAETDNSKIILIAAGGLTDAQIKSILEATGQILK